MDTSADVIASPDAIIAAARRYVGVPYHHAGRTRGGLDCIGLVVVALQACGVPYDDEKLYSSLPHPDYFYRRLCDNFVEVPTSEVQAGAVGFFWVSKPRLRRHIALFTREGIIHSYDLAKPKPGRVLEQSFGLYWKQRLAHLFRIPGVSWQPASSQ